MLLKCVYRSDLDGLHKGVYNEDSYKSLERRRTTSIGVCFLGWLIELSLTILIGIWLLLNLGAYPYFEFFNAIVRAIVIPFVHVLNDEDTKTIMTEESWHQGIRQALGMFRNPVDNSN